MTTLGLIHVMCRNENRRPCIGKRKKFRPEVAAAFRVNRAGWFIEKQQFRFVEHSTRQRQALFLSSAHCARQLFHLLAEIIAIQQVVNPGFAFCTGVRVHVSDEAQVLEDGEITVKRKFLCHVANSGLEWICVARNFESQDTGAAFRRGQQAAKHANGRCLTGTVRPQEAVDD